LGEPQGLPRGSPMESFLKITLLYKLTKKECSDKYMPSKDTIPFHLTRETASQIDKIRKVMAEELNIPLDKITKKHGEIAMRIKSSRGKLLHKELEDILLGRIK